jgi:hypothetical protein
VSLKSVDMTATCDDEVEEASDPRRPRTCGLRGLGYQRSRRPQR